MDLKNIKIGVLAGGVSGERDVSLESGKQVMDSFYRSGVNAVFIDLKTTDKEKIKVLLEANSVDLAFIALHGEFGEDGKIQRMLSEIGLPYTGSLPLASHLAMNKITSKLIFRKNGILTASFRLWRSKCRVPNNVVLPAVVKPYFSGSSLGVSIVREFSQLQKALDLALSVGDIALIEDYISGRELTVGVLNGKALEVVEITPKCDYFDYQTKYSDGNVVFNVPAKLDNHIYSKIQSIALAAHNSLGCRHFSRVDMLLSGDHTIYVLEVNAIPGLTSHSLFPLSAKHQGISFDNLILQMTRLALDGTRTQKKISV
ncbi:MAG: D-alanine--D-alanine ligase [Candidatus Omnitrophica bacterium]|nr:D-alanine--D-alanine ligase [Candidatus Omnitrophota bacterium]